MRLILFAAIFFSGAVFSAPAGASNDLPFALTISGGISLGAYEAGVNWSLIEFMRKVPSAPPDGSELAAVAKMQPDLRALTGASAGSINAVLTAMAWCVAPEKEGEVRKKIASIEKNAKSRLHRMESDNPIDINLIRDPWVSVGIDELMPKDTARYTDPGSKRKNPDYKMSPFSNFSSLRALDVPPDAMFARSAFGLPMAIIKEMLDQPVFRNPCEVPLALLTTREEPIEYIKGNVKVKNQRLVFLLKFVTDKSGFGRFVSPVEEEWYQNIGTVAFLPGKSVADREIDRDDVIKLMLASSAFPVAFSKVELDYCTKGYEGGTVSTRCDNDRYLTSSNFVDGGVFDNVPLGVARALVEDHLEPQKREDDRYFFYISPSVRRNVPTPWEDPLQKKPRTFGLKGLLSFLPGAITTSSDYELYSVLKNSKDWGNCRDNHKRKLITTSRYFPITGEFLGHFGAFLDQPFREFDYYAGIYDTVNDLAEFTCIVGRPNLKQAVPGREELDVCVGENAERIYKLLGIGKKDTPAATVFSLIAAQEHADYNRYPDKKSPWRWINDILPNAEDDSMKVIYRSMIETIKSPVTSDDTGELFRKLVGRLRENNYGKIRDKNNNGKIGDHRQVIDRIVSRCNDEMTSWYAPMVGRAGKRLQQLQSDEAAQGVGGVKGRASAALVALGTGKFFGYDDILTFGPSSEARSDWGYKFLPYELNADAVNGGFSVAYLPQLKVQDWSLDLKLTPVGVNKFGRERIWFSQADLYGTYHIRPLLSSLGAGPTVNYTWEKAAGYNRSNLGFAGFIEIFKTIRFTFGVRSLETETGFSGNNYYTMIGLTDLPGFFSRLVHMKW